MRKLIRIALICLVVLTGSNTESIANHIFGGQITYYHVSGTTYHVVKTMYSTCAASSLNGQLEAFPATGSGSVAVVAPRTFRGEVDNTYIYNPCLQPPPQLCLEKEVFEANMNLEHGRGGWTIATAHGNRNATLVNIQTPDLFNIILVCTVPDPNDPAVGTPNSSPTFADPPPNLCLNDFIVYDHSGDDPDGDVLSYSQCTPKGINDPAGVFNPPIPPPPHTNVRWAAGYSEAYPIDATPGFTIDPNTGSLSGQPTSNGMYVWGVCYEEKRGGVVISEGTRDYSFRVINCGPRTPKLNPVGQTGLADSSGYCADNLTVSFKNNSTDAVTYFWNFGDPTTEADTSILKEPSYTYPSQGIYSVWLYLNKGFPDCTDSVELIFEIYKEVDAYFTPPPAQCLTGNIFEFAAEGDYPEGSTYEWSFGNATPPTSSDSAVSVTFLNEGFHTVTLTVTNGPCQSSFTETIEILSAPNPSFDEPQDTCIDINKYTFIAKGADNPGTTFFWSFGEAGKVNPQTATSPNVSNVTYQDTGKHYITLTATEQGCVFSYTDSVYIYPAPTAEFGDYSAPQCLNLNEYTFFPTSPIPEGATIEWDFGANAEPSSSNEDTVVVKYTTPGVYFPTLRVTSYGCTAIYQDQVNVVDAPFGFVSDQAAQCIEGNSFTFNGTGVFGNSATFNWTFPSGVPANSTNKNETVTFTATGTHTVLFEVTENGCTDIYPLEVIVSEVPTPSFSNIADQCISNGPFDFVYDGGFGDSARFTWDLGGGSISSGSSSTINDRDVFGVDFSTPGPRTVRVTVEENGCTEVYEQSFTLFPAPVASYDKEAPQCVDGNEFTLNNTGVYGAGAIVNWDFGDASIPNSSAKNPTVSYTSPGNYAVTLSVEEFGCLAVYTDTLFVTEIPSPYFTSGSGQCVDSNSFNFTLEGGYGPTATFSWSFPGAVPSTSTVENPTGIKYTSVGSHPVTVTVFEYGCSNSYTTNAIVTEAPNPVFAGLSNGCVTKNSYFINAGGTFSDSASFYWTFENATPAQANTETVGPIQFNKIGYNEIVLTISENGCTYSYTDSVLITPEPIPQIAPVPDLCVSIANYDFDASSSSYGPDATFSWTFNGGSPATATGLVPPTVSYASAGTYDVVFTISENGCDISETITVNVTEIPDADFTFTGDRQQCLGAHSIVFNAVGAYGPDATLEWNFGANANTTTASTPTVSGVFYSTTGWKYITLTVSENGCTETRMDSIEITPKPVPNAETPEPQCVANCVNFVGGGTYGADATFLWNFGSNASPSTATTENVDCVKFSSPGSYTVTFTVYEYGCAEPQNIAVEITPEPNASFRAIDDAQCVVNNSFDWVIDNQNDLSTNATYFWDFGANATPSSSALSAPKNIKYSTPGEYEVKLIVEDNGCIDSSEYTITVYPEPVPDFESETADCAPFEVDFEDMTYTVVNLEYFWDFGDTFTSTEQNPTHTYTKPGFYTVTLTVTDNIGCPGDYSITKTNYIEVYEPPVAQFDVVNQEVSVFDGVIEFFNTGDSTDIVDVLFDFDDETFGYSIDTTHYYDEAGYYYPTLIVENTNGCLDTFKMEIYIRPEFKFYAPNAFSPDDDGINDAYTQHCLGFATYEMHIYSRWGEEIFFTTDINEGWNGEDLTNSTLAKQDTYVYLTKITDVFGEQHVYKGSVTLIR